MGIHTDSAILLTLDEFERLPEDEWRTELVRGRVVREPPAWYVEANDLAGDVLEGYDVLPDFSVPVAEIFARSPEG